MCGVSAALLLPAYLLGVVVMCVASSRSFGPVYRHAIVSLVCASLVDTHSAALHILQAALGTEHTPC